MTAGGRAAGSGNRGRCTAKVDPSRLRRSPRIAVPGCKPAVSVIRTLRSSVRLATTSVPIPRLMIVLLLPWT